MGVLSVKALQGRVDSNSLWLGFVEHVSFSPNWMSDGWRLPHSKSMDAYNWLVRNVTWGVLLADL